MAESNAYFTAIIRRNLATPLNIQEQPLKVVLHKIVLRNFTKFTAKHLYRTLYFHKIARNVLVEFAEFFGTSFYREPAEAATGGVP